MPRQKLTPEEIRRAFAKTYKRQAYFAKHPEEKFKQDARAKARDQRARERRLAKHQPELTDIQSNGKWVDVTFIRNGVVVYGTYKLVNDFSVEGYQREHATRFARFAARVAADEAREKHPPDLGKTPLS